MVAAITIASSAFLVPTLVSAKTPKAGGLSSMKDTSRATAMYWEDFDAPFVAGEHAVRGQDRPYAPIIFLHYDYMVQNEPNAFSPAHSDAPNEASIEALLESFRRQGITVVIDPRHTELPHALLMGFDLEDYNYAQYLAQLRGADAAYFAALKAEYFHPEGSVPWHYAIFGHAGANPSIGYSTGEAELPGYDFMVTVGYSFHTPGYAFDQCGTDFSAYDGICVRIEAGHFMHELGHNLDLHHGGADDENFKPNYLSVMNYEFYNSWIRFAASPGSTEVAGRRLDYSERTYPNLDENHLDERVGLGGPPDDLDISVYTNRDDCPTISHLVPATGPIDWNCNDAIEPDVAVDLNEVTNDPFLSVLTGFNDWDHVNQWIRTPAYVTGRAPRGKAVP